MPRTKSKTATSRKPVTRTRKTQPRPDVARLEERLVAIERRLAILEARQAKPGLPDVAKPATTSRSGSFPDSEPVHVRDVEKP